MDTKKSTIFWLLFLFIIVIYSCDIPGMIIIENISGADALYRYQVINKNDSVEVREIKLGRDHNSNKADIMLGFIPFWTDEWIKKYLDKVKKIEIIHKSDTTLLIDKKEMFDFFKNKRKGLYKNVIKIIIE